MLALLAVVVGQLSAPPSPPPPPAETVTEAVRGLASFVDKNLLTVEFDAFDVFRVRQGERSFSLSAGTLSASMDLVPAAKSVAESAERAFRLSRALNIASASLSGAGFLAMVVGPLYVVGPALGALMLASLFSMGAALVLAAIALPVMAGALREAASAMAMYNRGLLEPRGPPAAMSETALGPALTVVRF